MSVYETKKGTWYVGSMHEGKRTTIYLGKGLTESEGRRRGEIVESVLACKRSGAEPSKELSRRCGTLPSNVRSTLGRYEYIVPESGWEAFFAQHAETKSHVKPGTQSHYRTWYGHLSERFSGTDVSSVTKSRAESFRNWCLDRWSESTVSRGVRTCRTIFRFAVDRGLIATNPFDGIKGGDEVNVQRQFYVDRALISRVMIACRDDRERLAIALARFAGFRVPSEIRDVRFRDFGRDVVRIHEDTKTGSRDVPLFTEVREIFERLKGRPDELVFEGRFRSKQGAWGMLSRTINRAKIEHWPKLWTNLRSSCITDFVALGYSEKALDAVFGNSARIREAHYVQFKKEVEYRKMLRDNALIVEYLRSHGGTMEGDFEPLTLRKIVVAHE